MPPERIARRRRMIAIGVTAAILLGALAWGLTYTPLFAAKHIRVSGNGAVPSQRIRQLAGINDQTNVAHLDESAVEAALLADPWIASAVVRADLPDTVAITIDERPPVGVVEGLGQASILAGDGTVLPRAGGLAGALPVVRAALGAPTDEQRLAAASLLSALDPVVFARVADVLVGQDGDVAVMLRSGVEVDAGQRGSEPQKADALRAILRWAATEHVHLTSIDVSTPLAPSVELSDGSSASL
jgi:cell division protein FtsQ